MRLYYFLPNLCGMMPYNWKKHGFVYGLVGIWANDLQTAFNRVKRLNKHKVEIMRNES